MIGNIYKLYGDNGYTAIKVYASKWSSGYVPVADISDGYLPIYTDIVQPNGSIMLSNQWLVLSSLRHTILPRIPKVGCINMKYLPFFRNIWQGAPWAANLRSASSADVAHIIHETQCRSRP